MLIPTPQNSKTITDLREDALGTLKSAKKHGLVYVMYKSKPHAVIIDIDRFADIQERIDEMLDKIDASELKKEPRERGIPLEKVLAEYGL